jgi:GTP-binding protein
MGKQKRRLPVVAIVGRPNTGKSTLFNRLTRTRSAIVDSVPGVTRDRIEAPVEWRGRWFTLADTGGIDFADEASIPRQVVKQAEVAMAISDVVVFLVDARAGLNPVEREIAGLLRRRGASVLVGANKVDAPALAAAAAEFHALGLDAVVPVSAEQGVGVDDLLDAILARLPELPTELEDDPALRVAIVGRPNVGKSSLVNRLVGEERVLVADEPGTTRDAVDVRVSVADREVVLVDTAGLRRKGTDAKRVDHVARVMASRAVERCDVAVVMLDAVEGATHQDAVIAGMAVEAGAALVIALNKWDLVKDQERRYPEIVAALRERMKFAAWAPVVTLSVLTGERVQKLFREVMRVAENRLRRIPTAKLNAVVEAAMRAHQPPQRGQGKPFRVKYLTQVAAAPPRFVAFSTSGPPHFTWRRYLENRLREAFDFEGVPLRIVYRKEGRRERRRDAEADEEEREPGAPSRVVDEVPAARPDPLPAMGVPPTGTRIRVSPRRSSRAASRSSTHR